ncbi:hypothetical protein LNTAR_16558 [Lentisphaera araneosa HTCC2155]|uniref:Uncharacterized protein n=1 Tax=Lentisphaera araneosa HTCC2155 TaxID=313628 RepID=A6DQC6_9BACT|nr:hypothetical protein [Lentisphaera araneosa]EDM26177.1 hypothetical protein LNTAR_16558 [Lentisphaera araneosa HTCC2155]
MQKILKTVLVLTIEEVEFDYKKIKQIVSRIFEDQRINLQVEEIEEVDFEVDDEDLLIEIMTLDGFTDEEEFCVSIELTDTRQKRSMKLEFDVSGYITEEKLYSTVSELADLFKKAIKNKIIS